MFGKKQAQALDRIKLSALFADSHIGFAVNGRVRMRCKKRPVILTKLSFFYRINSFLIHFRKHHSKTEQSPVFIAALLASDKKTTAHTDLPLTVYSIIVTGFVYLQSGNPEQPQNSPYLPFRFFNIPPQSGQTGTCFAASEGFSDSSTRWS